MDKMFQDETDFEIIKKYADAVPVPSGMWMFKVFPNFIVWNAWTENTLQNLHSVVLSENMTVKVSVLNREIKIENLVSVKDVREITQLLSTVSKFAPCAENDSERSSQCFGYVIQKEKGENGPQIKYCAACNKERIARRRRSKTNKEHVKLKKQYLLREKVKSMNKRRKRLLLKLGKLKLKIWKLRTECAKKDDKALAKQIENLPKGQQDACQAILAASKVKNSRGRRFETGWIYECLLLRIKSSKAYKHLRKREILILPSFQTLQRYTKFIKSQYGFQKNVFEAIKQKVKSMSAQDIHGCLLIDEMHLTKSLYFNKSTLQMEGLTNLGDYTPEHQKNIAGDHALVILFQPFKGKWIQTLGCFLSKGSATGTVLHKIVMEAVILAEDAGLKVDAVTTDGASWNRTMWKQFGVTDKVVSAEHVCDSKRRLWFVSDFPHLIKCIRNFLIKHGLIEGIWTPDGMIALIFWYALLEVEDPQTYNVKVNFKLTRDHLAPKFFQKMNVALAFQFFGVADVFQLFKDRHPDLENCEPAIKFCERWKALISAMNCRTPLNAMSPGSNSYIIVENFLKYLDEWNSTAKEKKYSFMTESSFYGLTVTLKATLEITQYLVNQCGFTYLMTSRLNQDALERFFGMMRNCCGSNDHPDSQLFIQMYRLVSTFSLIQPPKGSNVSSSDIFDVLLKINDIRDEHEKKNQLEAQLDTILDKSCNLQFLAEASSFLKEHDYAESTTSTYAKSYIAGYVARKASSRFAKYLENKKPFFCTECVASLVLSSGDDIPERYKLIDIRSHGFLKYPSAKLDHLVNILEAAVMSVVGNENIEADILFQVTTIVDDLSPIPYVGCEIHLRQLTRRITVFYLTTRMHFISKQWNKNNNQRTKTKEDRKLSKLVAQDIDKTPQIKMKVQRKRKAGNNSKLSADKVVKNSKNKKVESQPKKRKSANN